MGYNTLFIKEVRRLIRCFTRMLNIDYDWQMRKIKDNVSYFLFIFNVLKNVTNLS